MGIEELLGRLRTGDEAARDDLRRMGPRAASAVPGLLALLPGAGKRVRLDVLLVLEGIGPEARAAIPALFDLLRGEDADLGAAAADVLGAIGADAVTGLRDCMGHPAWRVRQAACQALGAMGADARSALPALLARAVDAHEEVRYRAVWALGEVGDEAALQPLAEIYAREGGTVGVWIADVFARFGRRARVVADVLRSELHRDDLNLTLASAAALYHIGMHEEAAVWALITCLQQGDEDVQIEAAMTLADFGPKAAAAIPALRAASVEGHEDLRAQARLAITKIRPEFVAADEAEPEQPTA